MLKKKQIEYSDDHAKQPGRLGASEVQRKERHEMRAKHDDTGTVGTLLRHV